MTNIEEFFKNLHDKLAYVSSDGLLLQGTLEQKCKLEFVQYSGIHCSVKLEYNLSKVVKQVEQILIQNKENLEITYDTRDSLINIIIPQLKEMFVQVGVINYYNVEKISTFYDKEDIKNVEVKYKNGSTIYIRSIESI